MKNLKKIIALLLLIICAITNASAQENSEKANRQAEIKHRLDEAKSKLSLTDDQTVKFAEINKKFATNLREQKQEVKIRREQFQKMKAMRDEKDAAIRAILNPDQYAKYLDVQANRKAENKARQDEKK